MSLTVPWSNERVEALCEELRLTSHDNVDEKIFPNGERQTICTWWEVVSGDEGMEMIRIREHLTSRGVNYRMKDHGSDDWTAREIAYVHQAGTTFVRYLDQDLNPILNSYEWTQVKRTGLTPEKQLEIITGHFSDDPQFWLGVP